MRFKKSRPTSGSDGSERPRQVWPGCSPGSLTDALRRRRSVPGHALHQELCLNCPPSSSPLCYFLLLVETDIEHRRIASIASRSVQACPDCPACVVKVKLNLSQSSLVVSSSSPPKATVCAGLSLRLSRSLSVPTSHRSPCLKSFASSGGLGLSVPDSTSDCSSRGPGAGKVAGGATLPRSQRSQNGHAKCPDSPPKESGPEVLQVNAHHRLPVSPFSTDPYKDETGPRSKWGSGRCAASALGDQNAGSQVSW